VSAFVGMLLGYSPLIIGTDINARANAATLRTAQVNNVAMDAINCNLLDPLSRLAGKVDLLCFNPPYVATEEEEWVFTWLC
jgi:release factor glutamine methyltransferase